MANVSNHNINGWPVDGTMRSSTQYQLFAGYLAEGFRASASKSVPGDVSIFGFFFAILNLAACLAAGALLLIGMLIAWLFRLIFRAKRSGEEIYEEPVEDTVSDVYSPEMIDWLLSDEYANLCEERRKKL
ncbi:hypothetical protein [Flavobacterium xueshanense]|uniref:Uncharacterized protein n=1 Tax=Flavobacterium xueshanense TaxID=935223 RepID=A0A1I2IPU8_9FLAO|nr:hypothetical protein [Flavobacterium xueshanense]SFF42541.1 hypothetical protein SAMN04488131_12131 [Flavobacterium xueshanense]